MGKFLRISGFVLVALVAVLAYFHRECVKEKSIRDSISKFDKFNPDVTDCTVELDFTPKGTITNLAIGPEYILVQSMPCALMKTLHFFNIIGPNIMDPEIHKDPNFKNIMKEFEEKMGYKPEKYNVTIKDARKTYPGEFHKTGFTLIELEEEPQTKDWRTAEVRDENADIVKFYKQMNPHIQKLYPDAKKIYWTYNVVRGGEKFGDQPRALGGFHLDYHPNNTLRKEFHKERPVMMGLNVTEQGLMMGDHDEENLKFGVLLGVWKPIYPTKICDYPLALIDASTFDPEYACPNMNSINFLIATFNNLAAGITYSPKYKFYYYSFMNTREVLIFHQFSKDRNLVNPHGSFMNRNCPEDTEPRVSVEARVGLFF